MNIFMIYKLGQHVFGVFKIVGSSSLADHVIIRHFQKLYKFVPHRAFSYHA